MLLFLDIDGVMVPAKSWKALQLLNDGFPAFSEKAIYALKRLITPGTIIMLTTSHKSNYSVQEWKNIFSKRGVPVEKLQTLDNNTGKLSRRDEIIHWMNLNPTSENFIIIDDDTSLNDLPADLKKHLVVTSPMIGLTNEHVENALAIINKLEFA